MYGAQAQEKAAVRTDVPNKAFYKTLIMDTGIELSDYMTMPVTDMLGISTETLFCPETTAENMEIQMKAFCGSEEDLNGILLYPDGAPRYAMIYVNGGLACYHGRSLTACGRDRFRQFVFVRPQSGQRHLTKDVSSYRESIQPECCRLLIWPLKW